MAFKSSYSNLSALIVDDMPIQQTTLRGQLGMLQISKVDVASTAEDALRLAKSRSYALVLCDFNLNQKTDGQQLLEHLRENNVLPAETLFFMVTAENSYAAVAAASECKPDAYLLKPVTVGDIEERLKTQLDRRNALLPIHQRLARRDFAAALSGCDALVAEKSRWTMHALQIKGQTLLQLGRHEDAVEMYGLVLHMRSGLIWAQLGMAKAQKAAGNFEEAKAAAYEVLHSKDGEKSMEAHDLVAQCLEAQGDFQGALWVLKDSISVMPSARRQRIVGECAYRNGDLDTAKESFTRLAKATKGSITSQPQDVLALAQVKADTGEAPEALLMLDAAASQHRHDPQFGNVALAIKAQALARNGDRAGAESCLAKARQTMRRAKADFATVALAKAELLGGDSQAGLKLLGAAVCADHENPRVKQLIGNALRDTGFEALEQQVIDAAMQIIQSQINDAKALFRDSRTDEAVAAIDAALREYPENTGVLLQAAQMNCMSLRLKKQMTTSVSERVRAYLARLDALLPDSDRVAQMHRYYRDTVAGLKAGLTESAAAAASV